MISNKLLNEKNGEEQFMLFIKDFYVPIFDDNFLNFGKTYFNDSLKEN